MTKPSVDAGVPDAVASFLSRVLARCSMVTFFCEAGHKREYGDEAVTKIAKPTGLFGSVVNKGYPLTSSQNPAIVQTLFDADGFSWTLKSQRAFLSPPSILPELQFKDVDTAFNRPQDLNCEKMLHEAHVLGILLPGVDGDFAGIAAFSTEFWANFMGAIEAESKAQNIPYSIVDEVNFQATSWSLN